MMPSFTHLLLALTTASTILALPLPIANRSGGAFTGDMTYYEPGLGACGQFDSASELVVALSTAQYDGSCGRSITIFKNGKATTARVVDKCPSCASGAIDVSPSVFQALAPLTVGRTTVSWSYDS